MFSPKAIVFDLDGTLVDSVPDLAYSVDAMLEQLGLPKRGEAAVRQWVGNGVQRLVERALTNNLDGIPDKALFKEAMPIFTEIYAENNARRSRVYAGVEQALQFVREAQLHCACVTNKAEQFTVPLLKDLGLFHYFEIVISGDSLPEKKPHPLPLLHIADHFGLLPKQCLMVGDSKSDVKAAREAGFNIVCTSYGYNHGEDIRKYKPDAVVDSLAELKNLIRVSA
ncbi:phosphoglycolate phosphatase [Thiolinea disciformis]|uniref:phosphoglycolate phosphatase n=1 Tax=Thiolinea disciformis TaxID=125614 RepID=UPI00037A7F3A|nr:phosphoglycolate phosphatase [Thiolinea disciformis]